MPGFRGLTNMVAEQIEERIPLEGVRIYVPTGFLWLMRSEVNFLDYPPWPDPDDPLIVRLMVNLIARSNIL